MARGTYKCAKETKKRLLETVIELIKEKGYANVSVRDICRTAEVSSNLRETVSEVCLDYI